MENPYVELTHAFNAGRLRARRRPVALRAEDSRAMSGPREEFLSEEDLDLENLTDEELSVWWLMWLRMAQATNDLDAALYSHGVFDRDPSVQETTQAG